MDSQSNTVVSFEMFELFKKIQQGFGFKNLNTLSNTPPLFYFISYISIESLHFFEIVLQMCTLINCGMG